MLTELAAPVVDQTLLDEVARHLKIAPGYGADAAAEMEGSFRAALAHLEARLGLALLERNFTWRGSLGGDGSVTAPIGPVSAIISVDRVLADGSVEALDLSVWSLDRGVLRTKFCTTTPVREQIEITFTAGFGSSWTDTPGDLRQAVLLSTAHFFDNRHATSAAGNEILPLGVKELVAPWRPVRIGFGATA